MKLKHARRTVISSAVAIIICLATLIGTTFAWFTDSSLTAINRIESGNLEVGFTYASDSSTTPETVTESTKIFTDVNGEKMIWEPGGSTSGIFKLANDGTLALKYQLSIIYANATKTPSGKTLADAISVYAITNAKTAGTDSVMEDAALEGLEIGAAIPG